MFNIQSKVHVKGPNNNQRRPGQKTKRVSEERDE